MAAAKKPVVVARPTNTSPKTTATPAAKKPATPVAKQPAAPVAKKPATPIAKQPAAPAAKKPATPVAKQPAAPAAKKPATPITQKTPIANTKPSTAATNTSTPVATNPSVPTATNTSTPTTPTTPTPVATNPSAPAATNTSNPTTPTTPTPVVTNSSLKSYEGIWDYVFGKNYWISWKTNDQSMKGFIDANFVYQDSNNNGSLESGDKVLGRISEEDKQYSESEHKKISEQDQSNFRNGTWKFDSLTGIISLTGSRGYVMGRTTLKSPSHFENGDGTVYANTFNSSAYSDAVTGTWSLTQPSGTSYGPNGAWSTTNNAKQGSLYIGFESPQDINIMLGTGESAIPIGLATFDQGVSPNGTGTWNWSSTAGRGDVFINGVDVGTFIITNTTALA